MLGGDNLRRACKRVKANKGAPGIDGVTIEAWPEHARAHWPALRGQIEGGRYRPQPVRRVQIPKPGGGKRLLGIPTVTDRVVQQAIAQVLTPIFEATFSRSSFGFRPGRNAHQAIRQVQAYVKTGWRMAVDLDLAKFFHTVDHDVLIASLARTIADKRLLVLIGRYLRAGVLVGEHIEPSDIGTPQGGPLTPRTQKAISSSTAASTSSSGIRYPTRAGRLEVDRATAPTCRRLLRPGHRRRVRFCVRGVITPLLANILLDQLDRELQRRGHRFARHADDVIALVKSQRAGERVMRSITRYLHTRLKLAVNPAKKQGCDHQPMQLPGLHPAGQQDPLDRQGAGELQAPGARADGKKLGRVDGLSAAQAGAIRAGLDGVLRHQPVLASGARAGRLDQAANPHVLLEAVALGAHEDQASAGSGREPEDGDPAWRQQQELVAHGAHLGVAASTVQRVVESARSGQREKPVVQSAGLHELNGFVERADLLNRPLRTRTVGGVGAGS